MNNRKRPVRSFTLEKEVLDELDRRAKDDERSTSAYLNRLLKKVLGINNTENDKDKK